MTTKIDKASALAVWLSFTIFFCYQYVLRILPNLIMPELTLRFGLNATQLGSFASCYYIGYVACHIPLGIAFDRFNGKRVALFAILLTMAGLLPIIYQANWYLVVIGRLLIGAGSSAAIVGAIQSFQRLFPCHFSRALGLCIVI